MFSFGFLSNHMFSIGFVGFSKIYIESEQVITHKAQGSSATDQKLYMSIFFIKYVLEACGSRPGIPNHAYEYIPHWICIKS